MCPRALRLSLTVDHLTHGLDAIEAVQRLPDNDGGRGDGRRESISSKKSTANHWEHIQFTSRKRHVPVRARECSVQTRLPMQGACREPQHYSHQSCIWQLHCNALQRSLRAVANAEE